MHTIREITRLATMLAGLTAPQLRLGFVSALPQLRLGYASTTHRLHLDYTLAPISCEHCRSSRNNPHCAPRHVIYYFTTCVRKIRYSPSVEHGECSQFHAMFFSSLVKKIRRSQWQSVSKEKVTYLRLNFLSSDWGSTANFN